MPRRKLGRRPVTPQAKEPSPSRTRMRTMVPLPCLRCGEWAVPVGFLFMVAGRGRGTLPCRRCDAMHYLAVKQRQNGFEVTYQRYTLRHPIETYDSTDDPPIALFDVVGGDKESSEQDIFSGPVLVYPRKSRFTASEVEAIWRATRGRCHICRKRRWALNERGRSRWHIDHVIPHIGGGSGGEKLPNLRVACAYCNLKKGRGYTQAQVRLGLRQLVEEFSRWPLAEGQ